MSYQLYGSKTSPFVRRIRILLDQLPFEFKEINIFDAQESIELNKVNPLNQVPTFVDGEKTIWDSREIFNYLNTKHNFGKLDWKEGNLLTAIEGASDAGMTLLMMKRSGIDTDQPLLYTNRMKERMESVLDFLKPYIQDQAMRKWDFISISLYCFLDWATFRGVLKLDKRPECQAFLDKYKNVAAILNTEIPKA